MKYSKLLRSSIKYLLPHGIVVLAVRYRTHGALRIPWNMNTNKFWDRYYKSGENKLEDEDYEALKNVLDSSNDFSLLDIGCGEGAGCHLLQKTFPKSEINGSDFSSHAVKSAKNRYPHMNFFVLDITKDQLPKKYDYITIIETLEHITEPFPVVDKCLRNVNKSLIISVPFTPDLPTGKIKGGGVHVYSFNKKSFQNYNSEIKLIDVLHEGTMPRIIFEIKPN